MIERNKVMPYFIFSLLLLCYAISYGAFIFKAKSFWLDEWFVLSNIKFRDGISFFNNTLNYGIQFPRVYLILIQSFSKFFNFSEWSIRFFPYLAQTLSLSISFFIFIIMLPQKKILNIFLLTILLFCNEVTGQYYNQIKQYSFDILAALFAIYQFTFLRNADREHYVRVKTLKLLVISILFTIIPLFSSTYVISSTPILGMLGISLIFYRNKERTAMAIIPFICILIGIILNFIIDIRPGINDEQMRKYWVDFIANYSSFKSFFYYFFKCWGGVFYLNFFVIFDIPNNFAQEWINIGFRELIRILTLYGLYLSCIQLIKKRSLLNKEKIGTFNWSSEFYFITFFCICMVLYLMRILPIGGLLGANRINYFMFLMFGYFLVEGITKVQSFSYLRRTINVLLYVIIILGSIKIAQKSLNEFNGKNIWFSNEEYKNYGLAILQAQRIKVPIFMNSTSAPYHHELILQTHPFYNKNILTEIIIIIKKDEICKIMLTKQVAKAIYIASPLSYEIIDKNNCHNEIDQSVDGN